MKQPETKCEICGKAAIDRTPADYDGVKIDCPHCERKYAIADTTLARFRALELEDKIAAFQQAVRRASHDERPLISSSEV